MGKTTKLVRESKYVSKHATAPGGDPDEGKTAKERMAAQLRLLELRGQTMKTKKDAPAVGSKKNSGAIKKRGATTKKQKKVARALMVADKEEARIERQEAKKEMRKVRKQDWK